MELILRPFSLSILHCDWKCQLVMMILANMMVNNGLVVVHMMGSNGSMVVYDGQLTVN